MDFNQIIEGWKNFVFKNEEMEILAKKRIKLCLDCVNNTKTNRCKLCGCYTPAKVRAEKSKCPIKKW